MAANDYGREDPRFVQHRKLFQKHWRFLQNNLCLDPKFLGYIYSEGLLTDHEHDQLSNESALSSKLQKIDYFLHCMQRRRPESLEVFLQALDESLQRHISDKLRETYLQSDLEVSDAEDFCSTDTLAQSGDVRRVTSPSQGLSKESKFDVVGDLLLENNINFIESKEYEKCYQLFWKETGGSEKLGGVSIQGLSGTGKTMIANKLVMEYLLYWKHEHPSDYDCLLVYLNCESSVQFNNSINKLHMKVKGTPALTYSDRNELYELFRDVTDDARYKRFLFFFEDIRISDVWKLVNWMGSRMFTNQSKCHVICTAREMVKCVLDTVHTESFKQADIRNLFLSLKGEIQDDNELDDDDLDNLSASVSGHPMALVCAKEDFKFCDMPAKEWVESYIQQLSDFGLPDRSGKRAIKFSVMSLCESNDLYLAMLQVICYYNEKIIPIKLLHASLEVAMGPTEMLNVRGAVTEFIRVLCEKFFGRFTPTAAGGHLTIHSLVKEVVSADIPKIKRLHQCCLACLALNRTMDKDGRYDTKNEDRFLFLPHAESVVATLKRLRIHENGDLVHQVSYAELLARMAYCHLSARIFIEGKELICKAVDYACKLFTNKSFNDLLGKAHIGHQRVEDHTKQKSQSSADEIAQYLYSSCTEENARQKLVEHFNKHICQVQLYLRLSERDMTLLGISKKDTKQLDHLQPMLLEELRRKDKALSEEIMLSVYLPETLADLFYMKSRLDLFHTGDHDNQELLNECYNSAVIARKLYQLIEHDQSIELLNRVLVTRDCELNYRLKSVNFNRDMNHLRETLKKYEELEQGTGKQYFEMGLCRGGGRAERDTTHMIRCVEWQLMSISFMCQLEPSTELFQQGETLFQKGMPLYKKARSRSRSYYHQKYGEFLYKCDKVCEGIKELVTAMQVFAVEFKNCEEIQEGHFKSFCKDVARFMKGRDQLKIDLSDAEENYIKKVLDKCLNDSSKIFLADILQKLYKARKSSVEEMKRVTKETTV